MKLMRPFMKSHGFTTRGNNFYKRHPQGNIGIINFQKDPSGSSFTVNVSIYSYILAEAFLGFYGEKEVKKYPSEWDGHWRSRISDLIPRQSSEYRNLANSKNIVGKWTGHDVWWKSYDKEIDAKEIFDEVSPLIAKFAIPAINQHLTDEQLKNVWFTAYRNGANSNSGMLKCLATFFLASGEEEKLKDVLDKLGKVVQDGPQYTGLKRTYDTFMRERKWADETYIQEIERKREFYKSKKKKQ